MKHRILGLGALASISAATAFYLWAPNTGQHQIPIPDLVQIDAGPYSRGGRGNSDQ